MIERAQRAVVIGPICPNSIQPLVVSEGNMARAQVKMVAKFMCEKLEMSDDDVARCGPVQACSTNNDFLLVKFASVQQSRIINSFKKNLPKVDNHTLKIK